MNATGLSETEAASRLKQYGPNLLPSAKPRRPVDQFVAVIREPMLLLLVGAGLISFTLGEPLEATILMFSVCIVIGISLYQTQKTDKALAALKTLSAPKATVIRNGIAEKINSQNIVLEDVILLREGDRVPADAELLEVTNLMIDESAMTGESFAVEKQIGHRVISGTLVVKGHGKAIVTATGSSTEIGKIGRVLFRPSNKRTNLQIEVDRIVVKVATFSIASALAVAIIYSLTRGDWLEGALAGIASAMSLLPEELPIVLTVFLGLGAWRMSKLGVLVRSNPAIELLGQVSVLCVDKTGTITKNEMALIVKNQDVAFYGLLASPQNPFDPMDKAFQVAAKIEDHWKLTREYPVSEKQLAICQAWETDRQEIVLAAKGAPETIAQFCRFTSAQLTELIGEVDEYAKQGFRVLGVAKHKLAPGSELPDDAAELEFEFVGLAQLSDPVRPGVSDAVRVTEQAGVRIVMITGDYPITAKTIATEIGISNPSEVVTGPEMAKLTDNEIKELVQRVNVFSRMLPTQKLQLVEALKESSEVVAMTGDGVNDAPALRASHVGIAMGSRGSEVAREAADLVITDDSFISITNGIKEGRRIYANLRRAFAYIIAIHIPIFGMALLPVLSAYWPLVLLPAQIAVLELLIDPAASLAYENEKLSPAEMRKPPRKLGLRLFTKDFVSISIFQGLLLFAGSSGIYLWSISQEHSDNKTRAVTFATILLGNLFLMVSNRSQSASLVELFASRSNRQVYLILAIGIALLVAIFYNPTIRDAMRFEALNTKQWLTVIFASSLSIIWFEIYKALKRR